MWWRSSSRPGPAGSPGVAWWWTEGSTAATCRGIGLGSALALTLGACNGAAQVCTEEFRFVTVAVVDSQSAPVADASVVTTLLRTGQVVPVTSLADLAPGNYVVLDDGAVKLFDRDNEDDFRVSVTPAGRNPVTADYRFRAPGRCHIEKVSGPDTVRIQ